MDFRECATCAAKPGSPILCDSCLHNRRVIGELTRVPDVRPTLIGDLMTQPTLYILMRRDMASMNAGKAMAQSAHAANQFTYKLEDHGSVADWFGEAYTGEDRREPAGFGTTLTLGVWSERELREIVDTAREDGFEADIVLDNTYPVKDGKVTHLIPVITCGYVFTKCRKDHPISALAGLELHPQQKEKNTMLRTAVLEEVRTYLGTVSEESRVYIGCDSSRHKDRDGNWMANYTTAIVVHNIDENGLGHGCRVFCDTHKLQDYDQRHDRPAMRMMQEAYHAVEAYQQLEDELIMREVEVHLDVNADPKHGSNCAMSMTMGYVRGVTGRDVMIKPDAFAASYAADHAVRGKFRALQ